MKIQLPDGKLFDLNDNDVRLAKQMLGMPQQGPEPLPKAFLDSYIAVRKLLVGVGATRLSAENIAIIAHFSKQAAPPDHAQQWLIDLIRTNTLKTNAPLWVDFRNDVVEGKYVSADIAKNVIVLDIDGQERSFPFASVKADKKKK